MLKVRVTHHSVEIVSGLFAESGSDSHSIDAHSFGPRSKVAVTTIGKPNSDGCVSLKRPAPPRPSLLPGSSGDSETLFFLDSS